MIISVDSLDPLEEQKISDRISYLLTKRGIKNYIISPENNTVAFKEYVYLGLTESMDIPTMTKFLIYCAGRIEFNNFIFEEENRQEVVVLRGYMLKFYDFVVRELGLPEKLFEETCIKFNLNMQPYMSLFFDITPQNAALYIDTSSKEKMSKFLYKRKSYLDAVATNICPVYRIVDQESLDARSAKFVDLIEENLFNKRKEGFSY